MKRTGFVSAGIATAIAVALPAYAGNWNSGGTAAAVAAAGLALPPSAVSVAGTTATSATLRVDTGPTSGPTPTSYRVDRTSTVSPGASTGVCTISAVGGSCTDSATLLPLTAYTYVILSRVGNNWISASSSQVTATTIAQPPFTPSALTIANVASGGSAGKPEKGDTIKVVFNHAISVSSFCSTWSNDANDQTIVTSSVLTATIQNNTAPVTGNDLLTLTATSGACGGSIHFGRIDLGSKNYVTVTTTFGGTSPAETSVSYTVSTKTILITLGTASSAAANVSSTTAIYTPDGAMKDTVGTSITGTATQGPTKIF